MDKHPGETLLEHFETFTDVVVEILTMGSTPLSSATTRKLLTAHRGVKGSIAEVFALKPDDDDELDPADAELAGSMGAALSGGAPQPEPRAGRGKGKGKAATRVEDPPPPAPTADDPPPPADDPPPPVEDPPPPPPPSEDPPPPPAADPA